VLIYSFFLMIIMFAMISLGVDYGRMQLIKTELQRDADATARGALQMYAVNGSSTATAVAPIIAGNSYNPVDANSGVQPTITVTWGVWNASSKTFSAGASGTPVAVQVTVSRTTATGNAVPLTFPLLKGLTAVRTTCDVWATAIAVLQPATSVTTTVKGTSDIWLSGMPAGSTASWSDTTSNAPSTLVMSVTPGSTLSFSATGLTMYNGSNATIGSDGAGYNTTHMAGSPDGNYNGLQNGIQTLTAPQNSLIGVFLTNSAPNTQTPPATALDYSTSASQNKTSYTSLAVQQPFFIGDGQTSSSVTQSFVVPAGATRLYLGVFDGWQNWDNPGSLTVTTTQQAVVYLVK
jgi:hypothetical protein